VTLNSETNDCEAVASERVVRGATGVTNSHQVAEGNKSIKTFTPVGETHVGPCRPVNTEAVRHRNVPVTIFKHEGKALLEEKWPVSEYEGVA